MVDEHQAEGGELVADLDYEEKPTGARAVTAALKAAMRHRFEANEWVLCWEVLGGGGRADCIAVNLWGSRSYEVHGFEVKATRTDWLRELAKPSKADYFHARTHRWWLVAAPGVVIKNELPKGWGLLELVGKSLVQKVAAAGREEATLDHDFLAALARRIRQGAPEPGREDLQAAYNRGYRDAEKLGKDDAARAVNWDKRNYDALKEEVAEFQKATGTTLSAFHRDWPAAARWVLQHGDPADALRQAEERLRVAADRIKADLADPTRIWGGKPKATDSPATM